MKTVKSSRPAAFPHPSIIQLFPRRRHLQFLVMRQVTLNSGNIVHVIEGGQIKVYRVLNSRQVLTMDASEFKAWTYGETFFLDRETAVRKLKEKRMQGMKVILLEREINKLEDELNRLRWAERKRRKQAIAAIQRKAEKPRVPVPQPAGFKRASTCDACGLPISSTGHCAVAEG